MTERELNLRFEHVGDAMEKKIEQAAQVFDSKLEKAMDHRSLRLLAKSVSFAAGIGLIAESFYLLCKKRPILAKICFITGALTLFTNLVLAIIIKRK